MQQQIVDKNRQRMQVEIVDQRLEQSSPVGQALFEIGEYGRNCLMHCVLV
jgi:hypothetical protein